MLEKSLTPYIEKAKHWYESLSPRERLMVVAAAAIFFYVLAESVIVPIQTAYENQAKRSRATSLQMDSLPNVLERYVRYKERQKRTEDHYKSIVMNHGGLSYIESLVKKKAGIQAGFTIQDMTPRKFAEQYEQAPFRVSFKISDYKRLVDFLEAIVNGEKPLVLSDLKLRKSRNGDFISVESVISIIRRAS